MATDPRVHLLRLAEFKIPVAYRQARMDSYQANNDSQRAAAKVARDFIDHFFKDIYVTPQRDIAGYPANPAKIGRGLIFVGSAGTGKTHLAITTALEVYFQHRVPVRFLYTPQFIAEMVEQYRLGNEPDSSQRWWDIQEDIVAAREVPLLVLDDFGKEHKTASGFSTDTLETLLRSRYTDGRPTIITSNLPVAEWAKTYHESMTSFAAGAFSTIPMLGKDHRRG